MTKEELFALCKNTDFPQTISTEQSLRRNYNYLKFNDLDPLNNTCSQLIQHFHPSLWKANVRNNVSPYEAWNNDILLMRAIENRLKYKGNELSPKDIRAGLYIGKIAPKVSVFRPSLAKYIIEKYLNSYSEIFDPCSGYSGRLLGAQVLGKSYVGYDINPVTISESKNLIKYFGFERCSLAVKNSLCASGVYECLFTCPPYGDKEKWNQDIEILSADEWISILLENFNCNKYVFVVDKTERYKNYVVEKIENKSYLKSSTEYIIVIQN